MLKFLFTCAMLFAVDIMIVAGTFKAGELSNLNKDWRVFAFGAEYEHGCFIVDDGYIYCDKASLSDTVSIKCNMEILAPSGGALSSGEAGLAINDGVHTWLKSNYWRISLDRNRDKNYASFNEVVDSSVITPGNGLKKIFRRGTGKWQLNKVYKLELSLKDRQVYGSISYGDEKVLETRYEIIPGHPAVNFGKPVLYASGMKVKFSNLTISTGKEVNRKNVIPPWQSRPGSPKLTKGSGYFQVKQLDGRWSLIDPNGYAFFDIGTEHPGYYNLYSRKLGYAPRHRNIKKRYGNIFNWGDTASKWLTDWNFTSIGYGESYVLQHRKQAHTVILGLGYLFARRYGFNSYGFGSHIFPNVFSDKWENFCDAKAREAADEINNDPWCLGIFLDNELLWFRRNYDMLHHIFCSKSDHPVKVYFWNFLLKKYGGIEELNRQLGTSYRNRQDFLKSKKVPAKSAAYKKLDDEFMTLVAERYFGVATRALRKYIPNHMIIGCRFAWYSTPAILKVAGKYNDILSFNSYPEINMNEGVLPPFYHDLYNSQYNNSKRPMMITEWSFPAMDSGLPNKKGSGFRVDTQKQRALCYSIYANKLASLPFVVGCHFFMWLDAPTSGGDDGCNYGLVNVKGEPYTFLTQTASKVNSGLLSRHMTSKDSGILDLNISGDTVTISNSDKIASEGKIWRQINGVWKSNMIELPSGGKLTKEFRPGEKIMILERVDGTFKSAVKGYQKAPFTVVNRGRAALAGMPVIREKNGKIAAGVVDLKPGEVVALPVVKLAPAQNKNYLKVDCGASQWVLSLKSPALSRIKSRELSIGSLVTTLKYISGKKVESVRMDRLTRIAYQQLPEAAIATVSLAPSSKIPTGIKLSMQVQILFFKKSGFVLVRPTRITNDGASPVKIESIVITANSRIKGGVKDNHPGLPQVRDYYLSNNFWTGPGNAGALGVYAPKKTWDIKTNNKWTNFACYKHIRQNIGAGKSWTNSTIPWIWCFAGPDRAYGIRAVKLLERINDIK